MKKPHLSAIAALSLFATSLFGGGLSKYKGWDKSPQGDLMTSAERAQWASVKTDDDADTFVKDFLAKRSPKILAEADRAAANADKYFSVGNLKGSATERGKLVIILGPPTSMSMSQKEVKGDVRMTPDSSMHIGTGNGGQGASVSDMLDAANGMGGSSAVVHIVTFTYTADKLPAAYGKALTVDFEVDPSGNDRVADRSSKAELDRLYELATEAKIAH